jgi:hypothetical protein
MIRYNHRATLSVSLVLWIVFAVACGNDNSPSATEKSGSYDRSTQKRATTVENKMLDVDTQWKDSQDAATNVYNTITKVLNQAYKDAGRPGTAFDSMDQVKANAWHTLAELDKEWPEKSAFALSAQPGHVWVSVCSEGKEKEGQWRP